MGSLAYYEDEYGSYYYDSDTKLIGLAGNDTFIGGYGDDTFVGGSGTDRFYGGQGSDTVDYSENTTSVSANLGTGVVTFPGQSWSAESLTDVENVIGGSGNDTVFGNTAANTFYGGAGNDFFDGGSGADAFYGGSGTDTVAYSAYATSVYVDLVNGKVSFPGQSLGAETLASVENASTGSGNDTLIGNAVANDLRGRMGNDTLTGGGGADLLGGGQGNDTFVFTTGSSVPGAADRIVAVDFGQGLRRGGIRRGRQDRPPRDRCHLRWQ